MSFPREKQFQLAGWGLFVLSALLFIWSTAAAGDPVGLVASLLFLAACILFLIPLIRPQTEETVR